MKNILLTTLKNKFLTVKGQKFFDMKYHFILLFALLFLGLGQARGEYLLLPAPQHINYNEGVCDLPEGGYIGIELSGGDRMLKIAKDIKQSLGGIYGGLKLTASDLNHAAVVIRVSPKSVSQAQGYRISILPKKIQIIAHDQAGAFYAAQTLKQICRVADGKLKCLEVKDWPDYPNRGVMMDVTRDKVPTMKTLYQVVDQLAEFKINQLQLYTEHAFAYKQHKTVWKDASPMTGEQIMELDAYCRERFIELVPNQNSFGHLNRWLKHERYGHLAETPAEKDLSPVMPESIELLRGMYDDLLPHFSSRQFNAGCDETHSLGKGKSKGAADKLGAGKVYLDYLTKIHGLVSERGRTMQIWGDIVMNHPELVSELPDGITVMEWGYRAIHPYDEHCKKYADAGVPFYVCPGTSSWNSVCARTDNALGNLINAAENGKKHGAIGFLNTNWGDYGHWQPLSVCYPGYTYGAGVSWAVEQNKEMDLPAILDKHVYRDQANVMGKLVYDLGNAYKVPGIKVRNASILFLILKKPEANFNEGYFAKLTQVKLEQTMAYIDQVMAPLQRSAMKGSDSTLIKEELTCAANILKHSCRLGIARINAPNKEIAGIPKAKRAELAKELEGLVVEFKRLWVIRNRPGGLSDSTARFEKILKYYHAE